VRTCHACGRSFLAAVKRRKCQRCRAAGRKALPVPPPAPPSKRPSLGWYQRTILREAARVSLDGLTWIPADTTKRTGEVVDRLVALGYLDRFSSTCGESPFFYRITASGLARIEGATT
jgi:hypothetical protein